MRLLNTTTLKGGYFYGEGGVPEYAILSHTWQEEEVSFQDIDSSSGASKAGFRKIRGCCDRARIDGYDWVWIDTCCIDKSSSAELTEAINSMYRWYQLSAKCYVYMSDVNRSQGSSDIDFMAMFRKSRWFSRGWTLQELIAPALVEFYDKDWFEIGTKASLQREIAAITGIDLGVLQGKDPGTCNVVQRISWASERETTRIEDIAYCLLGFFGVNMPLLYGEGMNAFARLQQEIVRTT